MNCPKCGSNNVNTQIVQVGGKTRKHGNGILGKMNNSARGLTALCTLGMSNIVWKKSTGKEKTSFKNKTMAVCQDCGHAWKVNS